MCRWSANDIPSGRECAALRHTSGCRRAAGRAPRTALGGSVPASPIRAGNCLVDGDWAREVRRECGWLVVPESRDRASTKTVRLAVEIFRAQQPSGEPPRVFLHGGPGGPGGSVCTRRASRGVHCPCIATS